MFQTIQKVDLFKTFKMLENCNLAGIECLLPKDSSTKSEACFLVFKFTNYSWSYQPIKEVYLGQVNKTGYPMNYLIKVLRVFI